MSQTERKEAERIRVAVEEITDPDVARIWKGVLVILAYLALIATIAVVATALEPGPPF